MSRVLSGRTTSAEKEGLQFPTVRSTEAESKSTQLAAWINQLAAWITDRQVPFLITSIGMIVMLLWAGSFKMTRPGAESIIPMVSNSPLMSWNFKFFGPYIGSDLIGSTEWLAAILILAGYFRPTLGAVGGLIATGMFFTTSTMFLSTPGTIVSIPGIHGMRYMSVIGLFLFKDVIALGASLYLVGSFGRRAALSRKQIPTATSLDTQAQAKPPIGGWKP
jgi:uncharacterized membrane protein YkgB